MHRRGRPGRRAGMLGRGGRPAPVAEKWQKIPEPRKQRRRRVGYDLRGSTDQVMTSLLEKNVCSNGTIFLGRPVMEPPLQWACSGPTRPAAPTNDTVGAAGDTSRPYKWVDL